MSSAAERRVTTSMVALAERDHHRRPVPDLLVSPVAWAHTAVILHDDKDLDLITDVTGQRSEWIVERGNGHRNSGALSDPGPMVRAGRVLGPGAGGRRR